MVSSIKSVAGTGTYSLNPRVQDWLCLPVQMIERLVYRLVHFRSWRVSPCFRWEMSTPVSLRSQPDLKLSVLIEPASRRLSKIQNFPGLYFSCSIHHCCYFLLINLLFSLVKTVERFYPKCWKSEKGEKNIPNPVTFCLWPYICLHDDFYK